jgi:large subunit ribosomal protein L6
MSRIGKQPIEVPEDVDVSLDGQTIEVSGPEGTLTRELEEFVDVEISDDVVKVHREDDSRDARSQQGLNRSLLSNMVEGVENGYEKVLEINGVGYRAEQHGDYVRFDLGFSHPILFELPEIVDVEIEKQTRVTLKSPDNELLGQVAAKIRALRPPEPYNGKGIKYADERIRRKVGKAGVA